MGDGAKSDVDPEEQGENLAGEYGDYRGDVRPGLALWDAAST